MRKVKSAAEAHRLLPANSSHSQLLNPGGAISAIGEPFVLGLFVVAVLGPLVTWVLVNFTWALAVRFLDAAHTPINR